MFEIIFLKVLNMSLNAGIVIAVVLAARLILRRLPGRVVYTLWSVVFIRLLFPFTIETVYSLLPMRSEPIPADIMYARVPEVQSGLGGLDAMINSMLPAADMAGSVNPLQIWLWVGGIVWAAGVLILLLTGGMSYICLKRQLCCEHRPGTNIYVTDYPEAPFVMGILRPGIYLPCGLTQVEEELIVLHEQSHISHADPVLRFAAYLLVCIHWFNPLCWVAFLCSERDMERACDEYVMKILESKDGNEGLAVKKKEYSSLLLSFASGRKSGPIPLAFGECDTGNRIRNILRYKKPALWLTVAGSAAVLILGISLLITRPAGPAKPQTAADMTQTDQAVLYLEQLARSFLASEDGVVSLMVPAAGPEGYQVSIHVSGSIPVGIDASSLSVHAFEEETDDGGWEPGKVYEEKLFPGNIPDMTMVILEARLYKENDPAAVVYQQNRIYTYASGKALETENTELPGYL